MNFFQLFKTIFKRKDIIIDDLVFRFHHKFSVRVLVICGLIVILREYSSESIDCITEDQQKYSSDLVNTFCWIQQSVEVIKREENSFNRSQTSNEILFKSNIDYINRLHWMGYLFLFQAILFSLPHYLWSSLEKNKTKYLLWNLNDSKITEEKKEIQIQLIVRYLVKNLGNHSFYAFEYISTKIFCFINLILQIVITNQLLRGNFTSLGFALMSSTQTTEESPSLSAIFPRSVVCPVYEFSSEDETQLKFNEKAMKYIICLLPINLIIEKLFLFIWFWYLFLIFLSIFDFIFYLIHFLSKKFRNNYLMSESHVCDGQHLRLISNRISFGDWLLLKILLQNLSPYDFNSIITKFSKKYSLNEPIVSEIDL